MSTVTTIRRGGLTAAIDSMGAQLTSLALNGNEYLWQGDPTFWGKGTKMAEIPPGSAYVKHGSCRCCKKGKIGRAHV